MSVMRYRALSAWVVVLAVIGLVFGGCQRDEGARPEEPSTSSAAVETPTSTSTTLLSPDQVAAFDAYARCWQAYLEFGMETSRSFNRADFDSRVGGCVTNAEYTKLLHAFSNNRPAGIFLRGPALEHDPAPEIVLVGSTATVRDCMLDRGEVYDADDGRVLDPASGLRTLNIVELVLVDGSWKISDARDGGRCTV